MPLPYKCPICGCTEYYEIPGLGKEKRERKGTGYTDNPYRTEIIEPRCLVEYEAEISGDASYYRHVMNVNANVRLCKACGHMDLFNEGMLREIKQTEDELNGKIKDKEQELLNLQNEQKQIEKELGEIEVRLKEISKLLLDEDITIRKHNELEQEAKEIGAKRPQLEKKSKQIPLDIEKVERELNSLKWDLKNVGTIRRREVKAG